MGKEHQVDELLRPPGPVLLGVAEGDPVSYEDDRVFNRVDAVCLGEGGVKNLLDLRPGRDEGRDVLV